MNNEYVIVGKIGSTYGIKGWIKVFPYSEDSVCMLDYESWYLEEKNTWKLIDLQESRLHGKGIVAKFAGFDTPEQARVLTGKKIAILRSQLSTLNKNQYYWHDLVGLTVINQKGEPLGKVTHLMETGANDVLVVKGDKEIAIPYLLGSVITKVDLKNGEIHVDWELI